MLRASETSPRMFDNEFLDVMSRTHWTLVPAVYLPLAFGFAVWGFLSGVNLAVLAAQLLFGFVVWTFSEYWLHRTLFHWVPPTSWGEQFHFLVHGVHHTWMNDKYRLVMPPLGSAPIALAFFVGFSVLSMLLSPWLSPTWMWGVYAGFIVGYVTYDVMHYLLHHRRPKSLWMKRLRAHHMNHHHNNPDRKFGVSNRFWDRVFGTL